MDTTGPIPKLAPGTAADPTPFGKYLLLGMIARGGMAEVYRARARGSADRLLAIKCMRPQLAKEARFVEMFIREGKLAVLLDTESIVRTYEIGRIEGRYFIAMQYIGGKDLTQILRRCQETNQRIPVPHAVYIALKMCEGLHYAHTRTDVDGRPLNIVNRDVSPSNVRLSYDGEVKLIDFGIAQAMVKFTSEIGVLKGKFSYMSPEQIRGMPLDARTDVFSTGIVLHEMLTTEKLFRGDTEFALMEKVRKAEVAPPSKFNRRVPEALDRLCLKGLARDLPDRYQSAEEMAVDLRAVLESYRFTREEMQEFVRGLFRGDYAKEREEIEACKVSVPSSENGNDQSESSVPEMMIMEPSRPGEDAQIVTPPPPEPPQPERKGLWGRLKDKFSK
jgi:serine/threonine protein kinase